MIHREFVVDQDTLQPCLDALCALKDFLDMEFERLSKTTKESHSSDQILIYSGELFTLSELMAYLSPRLCKHEDIDFGDIEERGECLQCGATCDWHSQIDYDEDTGQEIVEKVVDEWYLPSVEETNKKIRRELNIRG